MSYGCSRNYGNYMASAQQQQPLESMYPEVYHTIYPEVVRHCNMLDNAYGQMYMPNREELEPVIENIYENVDEKIKNQSIDEKDQDKTLQYRRGGFLNDLVWVIFLNELLGRRRRRRYPGYGYYPPYGYYSPFGY